MAQDAASTREEKPLRIGLIYNLKRKAPVTEDDSEAEFDSPTTVDAIARAAVDMLLSLISGEGTGTQPVLVEPELIVRESCGCSIA